MNISSGRPAFSRGQYGVEQTEFPRTHKLILLFPPEIDMGFHATNASFNAWDNSRRRLEECELRLANSLKLDPGGSSAFAKAITAEVIPLREATNRLFQVAFQSSRERPGRGKASPAYRRVP
ncbi:MAG: hypothetical protein ABI907_02025 [Ramlibacter sp.]